jgi:hypothetical protein
MRLRIARIWAARQSFDHSPKIKKWRHFPAGSLRRINLQFGIIGESGRYSDVTGCRGEGPTKTPPGILSRAAFYIKEL